MFHLVQFSERRDELKLKRSRDIDVGAEANLLILPVKPACKKKLPGAPSNKRKRTGSLKLRGKGRLIGQNVLN